jgi:beta propeller repeat protein
MRTLTAERFMKIGIMALLVLMLAGCAHAAAITLTERRITTDLSDQYDPAISGDIIVYTDFRNPDGDVYYYDLSTNTEHSATTAPGEQQQTDFSDGTIVYVDYPTSDIMVYDVSSRVTTDITAGSNSNSCEPAVGGSIVAWQDNRDGNFEIYAKDLITKEERRITNSLDPDLRPAVNTGKIVWMRCYANNMCDIYAYDWAMGSTTQVTNTPDGDERIPDIYGPNIVYEALRDGEKDIYLYNLDTSEEKRLSLSGQQGNPAIWGDNVVFDDFSSGKYHGKLWNIPSDSVFDIPVGGGQQFHNEIWGNRVVYTDDRNGQLDIYMTEFTLNIPPVADIAGAEGYIFIIGTTLTLDGSSSYDPDGTIVSYVWDFKDGSPPESGWEVTHTYTALGSYLIELTVTDNDGQTSTDTLWAIVVAPPNTPPVAEAGSDQLLQYVGSTVLLDGSESYDNDGDTLTYQWTLTSKPSGSTAALTGADTVSPSFVADKNGEYTVQLVVSDGKVSSTPDTVTVSFQNIKPVANAGTSLSLILGETATLDGTQSSDLNGDSLTYHWSLTSAPSGSTAPIVNPAASLTTITPDRAGTYSVQLIVNDGLLDSDPGTIQILVVAKETKIITDIRDLETTINGFESGVFKNAMMQNTLINKLNTVIDAIIAGEYTDALNQLQNDILKKTDGCALSGAPDKNDWIRDCETQGILYPKILSIINELKLL